MKLVRRENRKWLTYPANMVDAMEGARLSLIPGDEFGYLNDVTDPNHARDFDVVGQDMEKVRRWIREEYHS